MRVETRRKDGHAVGRGMLAPHADDGHGAAHGVASHDDGAVEVAVERRRRVLRGGGQLPSQEGSILGGAVAVKVGREDGPSGGVLVDHGRGHLLAKILVVLRIAACAVAEDVEGPPAVARGHAELRLDLAALPGVVHKLDGDRLALCGCVNVKCEVVVHPGNGVHLDYLFLLELRVSHIGAVALAEAAKGHGEKPVRVQVRLRDVGLLPAESHLRVVHLVDRSRLRARGTSCSQQRQRPAPRAEHRGSPRHAPAGPAAGAACL
mmetsp:Transcript_46960/g.134009  ORF Transcript_46960/g.134009 Transcript_46960/m.134009 type:complete len:263 (-) Transcript_46960:14-802(-)